MNRQITKTHGAFIVTRVSTGKQDEQGTSPESQLESCRAEAARLGIPIVAEFYDAGISGAFLLSRPGMQAALTGIKEGQGDTLICPNIDRYSRDREHQEQIKKAVRAAGGRLVFCDMEYRDTASGNLQFNIRGDFAVFEREQFRERSMLGRQKRADAGQQPTRTRPPFGFHVVTKADVIRGTYPAEQLGLYQIVEEEAAYVREIFARYAAGTHSLNDLARWLNGTGMRTKRNAAYWRPSALRVIIQNSAHKGQAVFGRTAWHMDERRLTEIDPRTGEFYRIPNVQTFTPPENWTLIDCPPIVSPELWEQANARLSENKRQHGGNPKRVRMLSGLVVCSACGKPMTVAVGFTCTSRTKPLHSPDRYGCGHDRRTFSATGSHPCTPKYYPVEPTEQAVVSALAEISEHPEVIRQALQEYSRPDPPELNRDAARRELAAVDKALQELRLEEATAAKAQIAAMMAGALADTFLEIIAQIAARRKDMEDRRGYLAARVAPSRRVRTAAVPKNPEDLKRQALSDLHAVLTSPQVPAQTKRGLLRTVVEKVVCQEGGADVYFRADAGVEDTLQLMFPK